MRLRRQTKKYKKQPNPRLQRRRGLALDVRYRRPPAERICSDSCPEHRQTLYPSTPPDARDMSGPVQPLRFPGCYSTAAPIRLYFTDGIDSERRGLFGATTPIPEPSTLALLGIGALSLFALRRWFTSA